MVAIFKNISHFGKQLYLLRLELIFGSRNPKQLD